MSEVATGNLMQPSQSLAQLPAALRGELLTAFNEVIDNFRRGRWEPAALNGGKLCEVVYTICAGFLDGGTYPDRAKKPRNMVDACRALELKPQASGPHSMRVLIPRLIVALYDVRNNRSIGHVGGDVDPNHMDATLVVAIAKWVVAELIRVFHDLDVAQATGLVDALTVREVPAVWQVADVRRTLDASLSTRDQVLLHLYAHAEPVSVDDLLRWTEYGNPSRFRNVVLKSLHSQRLVEYDRKSGVVHLSPTGSRDVETHLEMHER